MFYLFDEALIVFIHPSPKFGVYLMAVILNGLSGRSLISVSLRSFSEVLLGFFPLGTYVFVSSFSLTFSVSVYV